MTGFVKVRRGLLEHLPRLSTSAAKLYLFLLLKVKATGVDQGVYRNSTRVISEDLRMRRESLLRTIRELESLRPKPFLEVKRASNRHGLTEYRVLRFDPGTGPETRPLDTCSTGPESGPLPGPLGGPLDQSKQLAINGLVAPDTEETYKNSADVKFRPAKNGSYPAWFEDLWGAYPSRKGARKPAFKQAAKVIKSDGDLALASRYLAVRAGHIEQMEARGAFVENLPHVERYFSRGLWNQEPEIAAQDGDGFKRSWE